MIAWASLLSEPPAAGSGGDVAAVFFRMRRVVSEGLLDGLRDGWRGGYVGALGPEAALVVSDVLDRIGLPVGAGVRERALHDLGLGLRISGVLQVPLLLGADSVAGFVTETTRDR